MQHTGRAFRDRQAIRAALTEPFATRLSSDARARTRILRRRVAGVWIMRGLAPLIPAPATSVRSVVGGRWQVYAIPAFLGQFQFSALPTSENTTSSTRSCARGGEKDLGLRLPVDFDEQHPRLEQSHHDREDHAR